MLIRRIKNEKGFTLLEVIIVVVIIAILAAAVIPRFSITRDEAEKSACKANQHMIRTQVELYRFRNGGIPTMDELMDVPPGTTPEGAYFDVRPYCPADPNKQDYSINGTTGAVTCEYDASHN